MDEVIRYLGKTDLTAPATLLGQNLEMCFGTEEGLLSERLANPKFHGPADPQTGVAPGWHPGNGNNAHGLRFELTKGLFLSGEESQMIHNYGGREGNGILQTGRIIRRGEKLAVSLWARAQHRPAALRVGIRMAAANGKIYDSQTVTVDAAYWKEYRIDLYSEADDRNCTFFCNLEGVGFVWIDQIHMRPSGRPDVKEETIRAIASLHVPVLRFPGGCVTTVYHWKYGTGPAALRPVMADPVFKRDIQYDFGTDEYLQMCADLGIKPHLTVNISTGTPQEAGEWAAYFADWYRSRGLEVPENYWQIGNEHNGHWEIGNMTGEMYADTLKAFVPAIRAACPRARIIAIGVETGEGMEARDATPWRKTLLNRAPEYFDLLALQCYQGLKWDDDTIHGYYECLRGVTETARLLKDVTADCGARGLDKKAALTEWNLWYQASHHDGNDFYEHYDVRHGLYVAVMIQTLLSMAPRVELANFYSLLNPMGILLSHGPEVEETSLAGIFSLYRGALPGKVGKLEISSPTLPNGMDALQAVEVENTLFCINLSAQETFRVALDNFGDAEEGVLLIGDGVEGQFQRAEALPENGFVLLPPLSIARFRFTIE